MSKKDFTSALNATDNSLLSPFISQPAPVEEQPASMASGPEVQTTAAEESATAQAKGGEQSPGSRERVAHISNPLGVKNRRVMLLFPQTLHDATRAAAQAQGLSVNEFVIRAVDSAVNKGRLRKD